MNAVHLQRLPPTNAAAVRADPLGKAVGEFARRGDFGQRFNFQLRSHLGYPTSEE